MRLIIVTLTTEKQIEIDENLTVGYLLNTLSTKKGLTPLLIIEGQIVCTKKLLTQLPKLPQYCILHRLTDNHFPINNSCKDGAISNSYNRLIQQMDDIIEDYNTANFYTEEGLGDSSFENRYTTTNLNMPGIQSPINYAPLNNVDISSTILAPVTQSILENMDFLFENLVGEL